MPKKKVVEPTPHTVTEVDLQNNIEKVEAGVEAGEGIQEIQETSVPVTEAKPAEHIAHERQRANIGGGYLVCPTCHEQIPNDI